MNRFPVRQLKKLTQKETFTWLNVNFPELKIPVREFNKLGAEEAFQILFALVNHVTKGALAENTDQSDKHSVVYRAHIILQKIGHDPGICFADLQLPGDGKFASSITQLIAFSEFLNLRKAQYEIVISAKEQCMRDLDERLDVLDKLDEEGIQQEAEIEIMQEKRGQIVANIQMIGDEYNAVEEEYAEKMKACNDIAVISQDLEREVSQLCLVETELQKRVEEVEKELLYLDGIAANAEQIDEMICQLKEKNDQAQLALDNVERANECFIDQYENLQDFRASLEKDVGERDHLMVALNSQMQKNSWEHQEGAKRQVEAESFKSTVEAQKKSGAAELEELKSKLDLLSKRLNDRDIVKNRFRDLQNEHHALRQKMCSAESLLREKMDMMNANIDKMKQMINRTLREATAVYENDWKVLGELEERMKELKQNIMEKYNVGPDLKPR